MGRPLIYLDANVIIRLVEGTAAVRRPLEARLAAARVAGPFLLTSQLSRLECRSLPLRNGDAVLLALYDTFFAGTELIVGEVTTPVIDTATRLRAAYNFRSPDAIHLATAVESSAAAFLTADAALARCVEVPVELL